MKPNQFLDKRRDGLEARAGELLAAADMSATADKLTSLVREREKTVALPGIGHIRVALSRALRDEWINLPQGAIYSTDAYDEFTWTKQTELEGIEEVEVGMNYVSKLYCVTGDKKPEQGRFLSALSNLLDEDPKNSNVIYIQTVTPKDAQSVFEYQAVTFVAVKSSGGKIYWFTLEENDNKGKIIAVEALQDEYGSLRDRVGPIDTCPIKAAKVSSEEISTLFTEIQHVHQRLADDKEAQSEKQTALSIREKIGSVASTATRKLEKTFSSATKR